jgi:hypothetical protein
VNSIVVGGREEGKSTLALYLAYCSHRAVFVFDPRGIFHGHIVHDPEELEDAIQQQEYREGDAIVYRFDSIEPDAVESAFADMCSVLFPPQFTRGGFALVVDESGELQGQNSIEPALRRAVAQHPTTGEARVHIIQTSHRLAEFHGKVKTCLNDLYIFRTKNPRDHAALVDFTGEPELVDVVSNLPKHHLVHYKFARQADGEQFDLWADPGVWYVELQPKQADVERLQLEVSESESGMIQ